MIQEVWEDLLKSNIDELIDALNGVPEVEIAEFLERISTEEKVEVFTKIENSKKGNVFCELNTKTQNELYEKLNKRTIASIFISMPSESRADFYKQLDIEKQNRLLPFLPKKVKEDVLLLSSYSDNTAGGIMSTDFSTLFNDMIVGEALEKLKEDSPSKKMLYYAYVVDQEMKMLGFVSLYDLILAEKNRHISDFIHNNFIYAFVDNDKEEVSSMIEKYSLVAIPILNHENQLVGIVRYDDAITVIKNEQTEDMEKMMAISSCTDNKEYLLTSCYQNYYKRIFWIIGLFFLGILTSLVLDKYEFLLTKIPILTPFFPMISSVGGNTGSQSSSVIIRALSLNEIKTSDFVKVVFKEIKIAIMMGFTLFIFAFCESYIISFFNKQTEYNPLLIATIVGISLLIQVIFSTVLGAILPLIVKMINKDPAVIATPAIMTTVDVLGAFIYFSIAYKFILK